MGKVEEKSKWEILTKVTEQYDELLHQGDFIKNVDYLESFKQTEGNIEVSLIEFPLVVVLTQECDATQHYNNRSNVLKNGETFNHQYLLSVIVAPVYLLEDIRNGNHLENLGLKYKNINSGDVNKIKQNRDPRYHYMKIQISSDKYIEYVVDFKHYFTVNVEQIINHKSLKANFEFRLEELFKEALSQRFANYLSRIGLPETEIRME